MLLEHISMYVCLQSRQREKERMVKSYIYIYIYIYMCVCVCVCVWIYTRVNQKYIAVVYVPTRWLNVYVCSRRQLSPWEVEQEMESTYSNFFTTMNVFSQAVFLSLAVWNSDRVSLNLKEFERVCKCLHVSEVWECRRVWEAVTFESVK